MIDAVNSSIIKLFDVSLINNNILLNFKERSGSLRTAINIIIIKKKHFEKRRENLLTMQPVIHSDRQNVMNAIDATSISNQDAFDAPSKNFAQIKTELNIKMSKIRKFYKSKEKNMSKIIS